MLISLDNFDPKQDGWVGFDLDGTLAINDGYRGRLYIGGPIPLMIQQVKRLLDMGATVKIVTARVAEPDMIGGVSNAEVEAEVKSWCKRHIGQELEVTCSKDRNMYCLVDDRAIQVLKNTGVMVDI